ncbi:MAG: UDP-N-acetylmuramyl-tripeptide synthetase [Bacillota bacterium]|nr:UDP-N-acetylmuramyl-tripeptide synthetase [Bacillota bacterium]
MHSLELQDITAGLKYSSLYHWKNISVSGIGYNSGQIKPGNVFVAVKGLKHDGHRFIPEALGRGATVIVAEEKPYLPSPAIWIHVPDSRLALSLMAANFYGQPSQHFSLIGVTGTCGKTTTTSMLREIYETAGLISGMIGTVEVHCARQTWLSRLTTPDSLELQRYLHLMVESGVSHAAMEVSSHGLALKRVDGITFQGAIFTNISPNHLDFHKNIEDYAATKGRLASLVKPEGFLLINKDDGYLQKLSFSTKSKCFYFGTLPSCDFMIQDTILGEQGSSFLLKVRNRELMESLTLEETYPLRIPLPGMHNVSNAAAAAAGALLSGLRKESVADGLASFRGVERRMQIHNLAGLQVIDDTAMNSGSIDAVFNAIRSLSPNKLVLVYAIRGRRGVKVNEDNGKALGKWVKDLQIKYFFSTSSISHVDERNQVLPEEEDAFFSGVISSGLYPCHYPELKDALAQALEVAAPGSALILLGAQGMDAGVKILQEQLTVPVT